MARILVLEGYKYLRALYLQELQDAGYEVVLAADGNEAIAKFNSTRPNLVVMDICGRRAGGPAVMVEIMGRKDRPPVILNTVELSSDDLTALPKADAWVSKSSDLSALKDKIRELLAGLAPRRVEKTGPAPVAKASQSDQPVAA